jgi:hypothetical protein
LKAAMKRMGPSASSAQVLSLAPLIIRTPLSFLSLRLINARF